METKKIARACFIGGAFCVAVALMVAPSFWWLGLLAGFAGGYLGYEFQEVLRAIPRAWKAARRHSSSAWDKALRRAKEWLAKPHPFLYPAAVITTPLYVWLVYLISPFFISTLSSASSEAPLLFTGIMFFLYIAMIIAYFIVFSLIIATVIIRLFAFIGARVGEHCYWTPFSTGMSEEQKKEIIQQLQEKGYHEAPATYKNVLRWMAKGFGLTLLFFIWTLWMHLFIGLWNLLCFTKRFLWHLFILVHSKKRLLCGIDGTIGGAAVYLWFTPPSLSFPQQILLIFFGGLLGAAFGVVNWEIVSKRILHLVPANGT